MEVGKSWVPGCYVRRVGNRGCCCRRTHLYLECRVQLRLRQRGARVGAPAPPAEGPGPRQAEGLRVLRLRVPPVPPGPRPRTPAAPAAPRTSRPWPPPPSRPAPDATDSAVASDPPSAWAGRSPRQRALIEHLWERARLNAELEARQGVPPRPRARREARRAAVEPAGGPGR